MLVALLLTTIPAGTAVAGLPRATPYRVGGPITLDTNLVSTSGASAWAIDEYLAATTRLPRLGSAFIAAERTYGVNARFLLAVALHESGWGKSYIARVKHNLFGYNALDRDPGRYATRFDTYEANIDATARFIREWYLTPGGRWWGGQPTLRSMQRYWSTSGTWGTSISRMASSIRLATIAGRALTFAAPVVAGPLHGGDTASIALSWSGNALPSGLAFAATWSPIQLDSEVDTAAIAQMVSGNAGTPASAPLGASGQTGRLAGGSSGEPASTAPSSDPPSSNVVTAARVSNVAGRTLLSAVAPTVPGTYMLDVEPRDTDGGPLPSADQVDIPAVEVRVWGDRAVGYGVEPAPDGTGAIVRITNTGRTTILADPWTPTGRRDRGPGANSSMVTVSASGRPPYPLGPVPLVLAPLVADLAPGDSITVPIPATRWIPEGQEEWLWVALSVGPETILGTWPTAGAWFTAGDRTIDPWATDDWSRSGGPSAPEPADPSAADSPPSAPQFVVPPTLAPGSGGSATPSASPELTLPPATPAPPPTPVTHAIGERDPAVTYRGTWGSASNPGYAGGTVAWSTEPGATATLTFTGSSVTWFGPLGPTRGLARVVVDGQAVATVDLWRAAFVPRASLFQRTFATGGSHTLTIEVLSMPSHPYVAIDGFEVVS